MKDPGNLAVLTLFVHYGKFHKEHIFYYSVPRWLADRCCQYDPGKSYISLIHAEWDAFYRRLSSRERRPLSQKPVENRALEPK